MPSWRRQLHRLDPLVADLGQKAARRLDPHHPFDVKLDYPPTSDPRPRYGHGRARHQGIARVLSQHDATYKGELEKFLQYHQELLAIPVDGTESSEPCWLNAWLLGLDTVSLYAYTRQWAPRRYIEVGSGQSTKVVARAVRDGKLATEIISIDPHPRAEVDGLCDRVVRSPLELTDLTTFDEVEAGDVVFIDGSHRVFTGSDMVAFYLDVLPNLPSGVLVGIHDILWPDDYLPEWREYWFSEQYLLGAYLLAEPDWLRPLLPCHHAATDPALGTVLDPLWNEPTLRRVDHRGFAFWFTIAR